MRLGVRRWIAKAAVVLVVASAAGNVSAQPSKADMDRADKLYNEGRDALDAGRVDEACGKLEASLAIDRAAGTLLNLARCHELQGKNATAWREYTEASILADKAGQGDRAAGARDLAGKIAPNLSKLTITASVTQGATVTLDGKPVAASDLNRAVAIDPGSHTVSASAPGFDTFSTTIQVGGNADAKTVTLPELKKAGSGGGEEPPKKQPDTSPVVPPTSPGADSASGPSGILIGGIVVGGVGLAGIGVGAAFGVLTMNALNDAEEDPSLCPDHQCTTAGREAIDDAELKGTISTVGFAVGGAALATGVVLIVLDVTGTLGGAKTGQAAPTFAFAPGPGDAGLSFGASF